MVCSFCEIPKYILPSPADVAGAFEKDWQLMLSHAKVTLMETFIGLFFGILIGFLTAVIMDMFVIVRKMIYPLIVISQTIPTIAIAPLLVIWLGYEMLPKIILIVLVVFFPIAISLLEGFFVLLESAVFARLIHICNSLILIKVINNYHYDYYCSLI